MGKIVTGFLSIFVLMFVVVCSTSVKSENGTEFQLEEKMRELEKFHEEFKEFQTSLIELSAAFVHFHHQQSLIVNGSSGEPGETETTKTTTTTTESPKTRPPKQPIKGKLSFYSMPILKTPSVGFFSLVIFINSKYFSQKMSS